MPGPSQPVDVVAFDDAWRARWPNARPIAHELRSTASASWVRFHSLPESKRYADNDAEYDELLSRHFTLLAQLESLSAPSPDDLRVVTVAWSRSPEPVVRDATLVTASPPSVYWRSLPLDLSDPDDPNWIHLYVGTTPSGAAELRALLLLVADDAAADVIICPPGAEWLYHPYDGGCDVIAPDTVTRDRLRATFAPWLSSHPEGL